MSVNRVGVIGAGKIGLGLAALLHEAGIEVLVASRAPANDRFAALPFPVATVHDVLGHDVVILSVPHPAIEPLAAMLARLEAGTVVIDTTNAVDSSQRGHIRSALPVPHGRWLADLLPQVQVARAFTHVQDELLPSRARRQPDTWAVAIAADDEHALSVAAHVVTTARYVPVPIGGLNHSAPLDPGGKIFPNMFLPGDMRDLLGLPALPE
jgi:8-hydroxy-5-deazaflavin:NADPH oxidoreductase